jgi:hypothetical protein
VPWPSFGHQKINWRLVNWLEGHLPHGFEPQLAAGVLIGGNTTREPDAMILHSPVELEHQADSAEELVLSKPFEIRLPIRDIAP